MVGRTFQMDAYLIPVMNWETEPSDWVRIGDDATEGLRDLCERYGLVLQMSRAELLFVFILLLHAGQ